MRNQGHDPAVHLAVIADDLTGAGDTGAVFAAAGLKTAVLLQTGINQFESNRNEWGMMISGADGIAVSTDSRAMSPSDAYAAVHTAAAFLHNAGIRLFYKKIDSTMRGQAGSEIEAVLEASGRACAVVCPALPAQKRIVIGGYLLVDGVPVSRSAAGRDPITPVSTSSIPALLAEQCRRPVMTCSADDLDAGKLPDRLEAAVRDRALLVCDAVSGSDLSLIAAEAYKRQDELIFAGTAGLAEPLAALVGQQLGRTKENFSSHSEIPGSRTVQQADKQHVIAVIGSVNPVTQHQAAQLAASRGEVIQLFPDDIFAEHAGKRYQELARRCIDALQEGRIPIISVSAPHVQPDDDCSADRLFETGETEGLTVSETAAAAAAALAETAELVIRAFPAAKIIASGGDTARAVLRTLECTRMDIIGEVLPGLPVCSLRNGTYPGLEIVTKAGGFGSADALVRTAEYLLQDTLMMQAKKENK